MTPVPAQVVPAQVPARSGRRGDYSAWASFRQTETMKKQKSTIAGYTFAGLRSLTIDLPVCHSCRRSKACQFDL